MIFRKALSDGGEIENAKSSITSVLQQLYSMLVEIDVAKEGVGGAKNFFEAKVILPLVGISTINSLDFFSPSEGCCYQRERQIST